MHDIDLMLELQLQGKHQEARAISDKLEEQGPEKIVGPDGVIGNQDTWTRHCFNRGWFLLQDGKYQEGCQLLEYGRYLNVYGGGVLKTDAPIYNPKDHDIKGKSIIISLEGGYGDELIHARFATSYKKLGAEKVYLAADPTIKSVMSRIEGVDGVILRNQAHTVQHDYWIPGFSAGWLAGHTYEDFPGKPYLTANPSSVEIWKSIINAPEGKVKVGIRWAGNPKFEHQQFRRFPEAFMTNLAKYPELQIYSLQRDHNTINLPEGITDLQHFLISWEDTAAAIMNLDIVITSCTSIAHLAAGLGKETWIVIPVLPYHTWTHGAPESNKSPYYEAATLFRQAKPNEWNDTFQKLYSSLEEKFNLTHVDMPNEDKVMKRINLGSGLKKYKNFLNVDVSPRMEPDEVVDLNVFPWPWQDNEFDHIHASHIIEHLGDTSTDFIKVIKEMYRISNHSAIWEISVPHWRCDVALDDPTHKRLITLGMFQEFNRRMAIQKLKVSSSPMMLGFEHDIDIEVCDVQFEYLSHWQERVNNKEITTEELNYALNTFNNVASEMRVLIQVHKPARHDIGTMQEEMKKYKNQY